MFSLKPKEGGVSNTPPSPPANLNLLKGGMALAFVLILGLGYNAYSTRASLQGQIDILQEQLEQQLDEHSGQLSALKQRDSDIGADVAVVTKRVGVTAQELDASRKFAERLKEDQETAREQLSSELATKASSTDVAAARQEASSKVAEVQQAADTKIGTVSGEVKTVAANLDATRKDLADSRREITDVKTTLSAQIARNAGELADLRKKGERDYFEFDIKKPRKNELTRVADIQLQLRKTDPKRAKYDMVIQVDDSRLEKKERTANEPIQFLVGRDKLRYEVVVNYVDKDRVRGYLSAPKDKVLAAERPQFRPE
jgi:chromosome segregation ATPase